MRKEALWKGKLVNSPELTKEFWTEQSLKDLQDIMGVSFKKWVKWIAVATDAITKDGTVWEPGCGPGYLVETLPEGCSYYGNDINTEFLEHAKERYGARPNTEFELADLYVVLGRAIKWDWVIVTSLFGLFPEDESYSLLEEFWEKCNYGLSVTTLNKKKYDSNRKHKNRLTSHDPDELLDFLEKLPGVGKIVFDTELEDGNLNRKMVFYVYRDNYTGETAEVKGIRK